MYAHLFNGKSSPSISVAKVVTKEMHDVFLKAGFHQVAATGKDAPTDAVFKDAESDGLVVYESTDNKEFLSYIAGDELLRVNGMTLKAEAEQELVEKGKWWKDMVAQEIAAGASQEDAEATANMEGVRRYGKDGWAKHVAEYKAKQKSKKAGEMDVLSMLGITAGKRYPTRIAKKEAIIKGRDLGKSNRTLAALGWGRCN